MDTHLRFSEKKFLISPAKMFPLPEKTVCFTRLSGLRYLTHSLALVRTAQSVQQTSAFLCAATFLLVQNLAREVVAGVAPMNLTSAEVDLITQEADTFTGF